MAKEEGKWISIYKLKNINSHIQSCNEDKIWKLYDLLLTSAPLSVNFENISNRLVLGDIKTIKHEHEIPPQEGDTIKNYIYLLIGDITLDLKIKISEEMYNDLIEIYSYAKRKNFGYNDESKEEGKWISIYKLKYINSHIHLCNEDKIWKLYDVLLTAVPLSVNFEYVVNAAVFGDIKIIKCEQENSPQKGYTIKDYIDLLGADNTSDLKIKISEEMYNDLMELYSYVKCKIFEYNNEQLAANEKKE